MVIKMGQKLPDELDFSQPRDRCGGTSIAQLSFKEDP
jgi:hypothetical protein